MTPNGRRGGRIMKVISLQSALLTAMLAIAFVAAGQAATGSRSSVPRGGGSGGSKVEYCKDCHGLSGQGYRGYLIMPRLAGQQPEYIENQLRNFAERSRDRDIFINMSRVHGLSPEMRTAVAAHFRGLDPPPVGGGPRNLVATGQKISRKDSRRPMFPHVRPAMVPTPRVRPQFPAWPVSSIPTP
jgi:cytochrome c553